MSEFCRIDSIHGDIGLQKDFVNNIPQLRLSQGFRIRGKLATRGHMTMSGDTFHCHSWWGYAFSKERPGGVLKILQWMDSPTQQAVIQVKMSTVLRLRKRNKISSYLTGRKLFYYNPKSTSVISLHSKHPFPRNFGVPDLPSQEFGQLAAKKKVIKYGQYF